MIGISWWCMGGHTIGKSVPQDGQDGRSDAVWIWMDRVEV